MSFFDRIYKSLFDEKKDEISIREPLKRSDSYLKKYDNWIKNEQFKERINTISDHYKLKLKDIDQTPGIHILATDYSNGFSISVEDFSLEEMQFLMDYLADKVVASGYRKPQSDVTLKSSGDHAVITEKHYLKPRWDYEAPIDQKFGNILLETQTINDKPKRLKLMANIYSDRNYTKALPFDLLMEVLLEDK